MWSLSNCRGAAIEIRASVRGVFCVFVLAQSSLTNFID